MYVNRVDGVFELATKSAVSNCSLTFKEHLDFASVGVVGVWPTASSFEVLYQADILILLANQIEQSAAAHNTLS